MANIPNPMAPLIRPKRAPSRGDTTTPGFRLRNKDTDRKPPAMIPAPNRVNSASSNPPKNAAVLAWAQCNEVPGRRWEISSTSGICRGSEPEDALPSTLTRICGAPHCLQNRAPDSTGAPQRWQEGSNLVSNYSRVGDGGKQEAVVSLQSSAKKGSALLGADD